MATYASYKKIIADNIGDNVVIASHFDTPVTSTYGVKWFYGQPCFCSTGCCCLWTVPTGVKKLHIEMWGAGGNGHGACSNGRCQHYQGAGGGYYNSKTIQTVSGCQYTVCAAGVYPCLSTECTSCDGCASYVSGYNLSNFCARGGATGRANASWTELCFSYWDCCLGPGNNGGDFGFGQHTPSWGGVEFHYAYGQQCHCQFNANFTGTAPLIGTFGSQAIVTCWIRCGCWTVPYGHGGQGAMTSYCGGCCGQGGTGGPGLVKITYF